MSEECMAVCGFARGIGVPSRVSLPENPLHPPRAERGLASWSSPLPHQISTTQVGGGGGLLSIAACSFEVAARILFGLR